MRSLLLFWLLASFTVAQDFQSNFPSSTGGGGGGGRWFGGMGRWFGRWPCHYPRMIDRLPPNAQAKVRAIWSNWKEGLDCSQERMQTRQLFSTLPQDQRMQIFQAMRQGFLQRHPEWAKGGSCGGPFWGHRQQLATNSVTQNQAL